MCLNNVSNDIKNKQKDEEKYVNIFIIGRFV